MRTLKNLLYDLGTGALVIYFLPSLVAEYRSVWDSYGVYGCTLLNLALGWTGVGWLALLIWAATARQPKPCTQQPYRYQEPLSTVVRQHNADGTWT